MYSVFDVANWFLSKEPMTHKKLQKLCYYTQAWAWALRGDAFLDDEFQAWVHGPVSPRLYERYKGNGFVPLGIESNEKPTAFPNFDLEYLESIWLTYGEFSGNSLEFNTHREAPWINARKGVQEDERCGNVISHEDMRDYYLSIYKNDISAEA